MLYMTGDAWRCLDPPGDANWSHTYLWQTVGNRQNIGEPFWAERYYLRNTHPVQFNSNSNFFYQISQIEDHYCSMHIAQYFSVILMIRSLLSSKKLKDHLVGWQPTTVAESTGVELIEATFPLVNWAEGRDKTWKWIYHSKVNLSLKSEFITQKFTCCLLWPAGISLGGSLINLTPRPSRGHFMLENFHFGEEGER